VRFRNFLFLDPLFSFFIFFRNPLVIMGLYAGISFLRSDWHVAAIEVGPDGCVRTLEKDSQSLRDFELFDQIEARGIFASLESFGERGSWTEHGVCGRVHDALQETNFANFYSDFCTGRLRQRVSGYIGISHPYGLSPVVRRALPAVVDREQVVAKSRMVHDATVRELQRSDKVPGLCALETPLAVVLELLSTGKIDARPGMITSAIIISPGVRGFEITAIQIQQAADSLALAVTDFCESVSLDDSPNDRLLNGRKWNGKLEIFHFGGSRACELAGQISRAHENCPMHEVSETDAACGVARYAALCGERSLELRNGVITGLDCTLVAPYAIGLCGRGEADGDSFWCPLIEAGERLDKKSLVVQLENPPDKVRLAECLARNRQPHQWVVGDHDLRWHSEVDVAGVRGGEAHCQLEFLIQSSAGCLSYGWSDPFAKVELRS